MLLKKYLSLLLCTVLLLCNLTNINADSNQDIETQMFMNELSESIETGDELPLPTDERYREAWIAATSEILEERNQGIDVSNVVVDENSVKFVFNEKQIEDRILLSSMNSRSNGEITYLGSVEYETVTVAAETYQTRIEVWYNLEKLVAKDNKTLSNLLNAGGIFIAVLGIGNIATKTVSALSLIQACLSATSGVSFNNNNKTQIWTRVQHGYTTKQVSARSSVWVVGALVQRHEEFSDVETIQYNSSNVIIARATKEAAPNATHSNYDDYEMKEHFNDDTWLKNKAIAVAGGQATQYTNIYKYYLP